MSHERDFIAERERSPWSVDVSSLVASAGIKC